MQFKERVMWAIIIGFGFILATFIFEIIGVFKSEWTVKAITAALNAILAGTMYPLVNHFFPALAKAKAAEKEELQ